MSAIPQIDTQQVEKMFDDSAPIFMVVVIQIGTHRHCLKGQLSSLVGVVLLFVGAANR